MKHRSMVITGIVEIRECNQSLMTIYVFKNKEYILCSEHLQQAMPSTLINEVLVSAGSTDSCFAPRALVKHYSSDLSMCEYRILSSSHLGIYRQKKK